MSFSASLLLAFSAHTIDMNNGQEWNAVHPGIAVAFETGSGFDVIGGLYYNSESNPSFFAGVRFDVLPSLTEGALQLETGLVTGYSGGDVLPMVRVTWALDDAERFHLFTAPVIALDYDENGESRNTGRLGLAIGIQITGLSRSW